MHPTKPTVGSIVMPESPRKYYFYVTLEVKHDGPQFEKNHKRFQR